MPSALPIVHAVIGGKYRIERALGEGAMGAVFEAENVFTHKRVAVKWLKVDDADAQLRLLREAQAAARVQHPNVVDVYDVVQEREAVFLVMEYLQGESLTAQLQRGGLSDRALLALLLPAMRGASAAHKQGVVHRDIKPDNIFLARVSDTHGPVPKLLDFGISKLLPRDRELLTLTSEGMAMGTPLYMSLEQLMGSSDVDARTDVYAFGVLLYEALTGQTPFDADTLSELAIKVATSTPVSLRKLRPDLPEGLCRVVERAMARDRDERTSSMDQLLAELAPYADEPDPASSAPSLHASATVPRMTHARRMRSAAMGALLAALALAAVGLAAWRTSTPARPARVPSLQGRVRPEPLPRADLTPVATRDAALSTSAPGPSKAAVVAVEVAPDAATSRDLPAVPVHAPRTTRSRRAQAVSEASADAVSPAVPPADSAGDTTTRPAPSAGRTTPAHKFRATRKAPSADDF